MKARNVSKGIVITHCSLRASDYVDHVTADRCCPGVPEASRPHGLVSRAADTVRCVSTAIAQYSTGREGRTAGSSTTLEKQGGPPRGVAKGVATAAMAPSLRFKRFFFVSEILLFFV